MELAKLQKRLLLIIPLIILLFFFLYLYQTSQKGFYLESTFLKESTHGKTHIYSGTLYQEKTKITVNKIDNKSIITIKIGDKFQKTFDVISEKNSTSPGKMISIYENNIKIFSGIYGLSDVFLIDEKGNAYLDNFNIVVNNQPDWASFNVSYKTIADIALTKASSHRASWAMFFIITLIAIIMIIDIRFPLFFFNLKNFLNVKDPEPTGFFISVQKIFWCITPIFIVIAFCYGLFI